MTDKTTADTQAAIETARADGIAAGATQERARIAAIIGSDAGKARPKAALSAALKTDMTVEQASAFLSDLAEEKATAPAAEPAPTGKTAAAQFQAAVENGAPKVTSTEATEDKPSRAAAVVAAMGWKKN